MHIKIRILCSLQYYFWCFNFLLIINAWYTVCNYYFNAWYKIQRVLKGMEWKVILPPLSSVLHFSPVELSVIYINPYRDTLYTNKNGYVPMLFILLIYLILNLKVDGSTLHVPCVPCFSHLLHLRTCSIIRREYSVEV